MKLELQRIGTVEVMIPDGPITEEEGQEFFDELEQKMALAQPRLVISFRKAPYVDSLGLERLISAAAEMQNRGLPLKLAAVPSTCREIFDLTELLDHFEIFDEEEDAVRSFL